MFLFGSCSIYIYYARRWLLLSCLSKEGLVFAGMQGCRPLVYVHMCDVTSFTFFR